MVVQVVPERVDQVDGVVSSTGIGVAREQHCGGGEGSQTRWLGVTVRPERHKIRAYSWLQPLPA